MCKFITRTKSRMFESEAQDLSHQKTRFAGCILSLFSNPTFGHFGRTPTSDRQADGRRLDSQRATRHSTHSASIASCGKNVTEITLLHNIGVMMSA